MISVISFLTVDIIPQSPHVDSFVPFRFIDTETVLYSGNSVISMVATIKRLQVHVKDSPSVWLCADSHHRGNIFAGHKLNI